MYDKIKIPYPALFGIVLVSFLLGALVCNTIITIAKPERMQVEVVMKAPKDVLQTAHFINHQPVNDGIVGTINPSIKDYQTTTRINESDEFAGIRIKGNESTKSLDNLDGDLATRIHRKEITPLDSTSNSEPRKIYSETSDAIPNDNILDHFNESEIRKIKALVNSDNTLQ